jgi:hypothetical protein
MRWLQRRQRSGPPFMTGIGRDELSCSETADVRCELSQAFGHRRRRPGGPLLSSDVGAAKRQPAADIWSGTNATAHVRWRARPLMTSTKLSTRRIRRSRSPFVRRRTEDHGGEQHHREQMVHDRFGGEPRRFEEFEVEQKCARITSRSPMLRRSARQQRKTEQHCAERRSRNATMW